MVTSILETIGHLILAPCVDTKLDAIVAALARHASRNSTVIKCAVCRLATRLINSQGTSVEIVSVVADFMMQAMLSFGCSELSLEATEFWHEVAQQEEYENSILSQIPGLLNRLIEALLLRIRWDPKADEDILSEYEKIDSATDSQAALLPRSRRSNGSMAEHDNSFNDIEFTDSTTTKDDDDESDSEYEEEIDGWSPRKCAGSTIDILAGALGLPFASMILPQIANLLGSIEWPAMEAAILALGAIAEGCGPAVQPHLSQILPILTERCLTSSGDSPAALKAVAAWTLSRYAEWMEETLGGQAIRSLSETIRKSSSIRVRSAACSALASIVERGPTTLLSPQIFDGIVCPALNEALISYQSSKTRSILYDAIGAVAEIHAVTCLLPAIQNAWMKECLLDTTFLSSLTYDTLLTPNGKYLFRFNNQNFKNLNYIHIDSFNYSIPVPLCFLKSFYYKILAILLPCEDTRI